MIPFLLFQLSSGAGSALTGDEVTTAAAVFARAVTTAAAPVRRTVTTADSER